MVKTYDKLNASFTISRMEDIYESRGGKVDEPHRHNYYTVLVIERSKGEHKIDFHSYPMQNKQIYFVAPGQVHQVIEQEKSYGYVMTFANPFLVENSIPVSFIQSLSLFQNYGYSPPLIPSEEQYTRIASFAKEIFLLQKSNDAMKMHSIGAYLKLLLIECNNVCTISSDVIHNLRKGYRIVHAFKKLVDQEYKNQHSTSYYANQLNISPDHLNRTVKSNIGKSAKEYIQSRITTESKRLLYFTDLSNKEIGYELGFSEPANFSAFFKKQTLVSPSDFRKEEKKG